MVELQDSRALQETLADTPRLAAPGLILFGLTANLVSLHDAGLFRLDPRILAVLLLCGGVGQLVVAVVEQQRENYFGTTVFASYGLFWFSLIALVVFPRAGWAPAPQALALASYLIIWGFFSVLFLSGTARLALSLRITFGLLVGYFFLTAMGIATESTAAKVIAGYEGIICGLSAIGVALIQAGHDRRGKLGKIEGISIANPTG